MKNYKQLLIWQKGIEIVKLTYSITTNLPPEEKFGLASQMNRAAVSIPSNIAEGSSRRTEKDYFRFIEVSLGSCFELDTQCEILIEVYPGLKEQKQQLMFLLDEESKMLTAFMNKLQR